MFVGYAVIFGGANGLGYGFALQLSAQAMPDRKGLAMGAVTACYAMGGVYFHPPFINWAWRAGGISSAMDFASLIFIVAACIVFLLLKYSKAQYTGERTAENNDTDPLVRIQLLLWLGYGAACACGLMVLGHATGIVQSAGASLEFALMSLTFIALSNMAGGLIAGWLADRINIKILLYLLPLLSAITALFLSANMNMRLLVTGLTVIGFCYGAIIAVYPVVVSLRYGESASSRIYGRVFTAWGLAGLAGPWFAGYLFDQYGHYSLSLLVAGALSMLSLVAVYYIGPIGGKTGKQNTIRSMNISNRLNQNTSMTALIHGVGSDFDHKNRAAHLLSSPTFVVIFCIALSRM